MAQTFAQTSVGRRGEHRAAMYVRMSTSPQDHSIQHQIDRLNTYAQEHQLEIVVMYVDAGKSGLRINGRDGLQGLISDVQSGSADFDTVLVYDVSRWGRFQDIDESAHYEFICRQAGVRVVYCAEHFVDDGSPMYSIMKGMKRIMAAEYSRELGAKVLHAQCRFSQMGYKQGGRPGYGLRRVPIAQDGLAKTALEFGERKSVATDRVALRHGPLEEVQLVRRIFCLYVEEGWTDTRIAKQLCAEGLVTHLGKPWDAASVRRILINSRYCGEVIFNQTTRRLRSKVLANPKQEWVHCAEALAPMVTREMFESAQCIRRRRAEGPSRVEMLAAIRRIFNERGYINQVLCQTDPVLGKFFIKKNFGSYIRAFGAAELPWQYTTHGALEIRSMRIRIEALISEVGILVTQAGGEVDHTNVWNVLRLNNCVTVKISLSSNRTFDDGARRWRVPLSCGAQSDFVLCGLLDHCNDKVSHYLLLSPAAINKASLLLSAKKLSRYAEQCFPDLAQVFGVDAPERPCY